MASSSLVVKNDGNGATFMENRFIRGQARSMPMMQDSMEPETSALCSPWRETAKAAMRGHYSAHSTRPRSLTFQSRRVVSLQ